MKVTTFSNENIDARRKNFFRNLGKDYLLLVVNSAIKFSGVLTIKVKMYQIITVTYINAF